MNIGEEDYGTSSNQPSVEAVARVSGSISVPAAQSAVSAREVYTVDLANFVGSILLRTHSSAGHGPYIYRYI